MTPRCAFAVLLLAPSLALAQPPPVDTAASTPLTRTAAQAGLLSCAARIEQVSRFLGAGNQMAFQLSLPQPPRDLRMAGAAMEITPPAGASSYASAQFAAAGRGCDAIYQTVTYWPAPCAEIAATRFPGQAPGLPLGPAITTLELGGNARIFLMPAGTTGCISIKTDRI